MCLLTNKIDLGGIDFLPSRGRVGSSDAVSQLVLDTCHTTADYVHRFQVGGTGACGRGRGGSHTQRAGGAGAAQGGCGGLAGSSCGGGRCLSDHTGLSRGNRLTEFSMKLHNLEEMRENFQPIWCFHVTQCQLHIVFFLTVWPFFPAEGAWSWKVPVGTKVCWRLSVCLSVSVNVNCSLILIQCELR